MLERSDARFEFLHKANKATREVTDVVLLVHAMLLQSLLELLMFLDECLSSRAEIAFEPCFPVWVLYHTDKVGMAENSRLFSCKNFQVICCLQQSGGKTLNGRVKATVEDMFQRFRAMVSLRKPTFELINGFEVGLNARKGLVDVGTNGISRRFHFLLQIARLK